jgi:type IV secretory pathway TrbD component
MTPHQNDNGNAADMADLDTLMSFSRAIVMIAGSVAAAVVLGLATYIILAW